MAVKRKLIVKADSSDDEEEQKELNWSEWTKSIFFKYWYIVLILFVDCFVSLEIYVLDSGLRLAFIAVFLLAAVLIEIKVYMLVWSEGGIWNFDDS